MRAAFKIASASLAGLVTIAPASATIVYDNFGPGNSYDTLAAAS
jgi:hypothetical protein